MENRGSTDHQYLLSGSLVGAEVGQYVDVGWRRYLGTCLKVGNLPSLLQVL